MQTVYIFIFIGLTLFSLVDSVIFLYVSVKKQVILKCLIFFFI